MKALFRPSSGLNQARSQSATCTCDTRRTCRLFCTASTWTSPQVSLPLLILRRGRKLTQQAGERVGLVGATGSGKSTLALSIFRGNQQISGSIKIDGVDIGSLALKELRKRLNMVVQESTLCSGTLRDALDISGERGESVNRECSKGGADVQTTTRCMMRSARCICWTTIRRIPLPTWTLSWLPVRSLCASACEEEES